MLEAHYTFCMPVDPNALNFFSSVFPTKSVSEVSEVMSSPFRKMVQINMNGGETLAASLIATRGVPENMPFAFITALVETLDAPIHMLNVVFQSAVRESQNKPPDFTFMGSQG